MSDLDIEEQNKRTPLLYCDEEKKIAFVPKANEKLIGAKNGVVSVDYLNGKAFFKVVVVSNSKFKKILKARKAWI